MQLYNGDCLEVMKKIPDKHIGTVICDLPYGVTDHSWDVVIPPEKLFAEYRRVCKQNANIVLFCQQPFTTNLITSAFKTEFSHMLIWVKDTKTRCKSSKHVPMAQYEEAVVFRINKCGNKERHLELRDYFTQELKKSGMSVLQIEDAIGNKAAHHFFRYSSDFRIPTQDVYQRLQKVTGLFNRPYEGLRKDFDDERQNLCTYNSPQDNTNVIYCPTPKGKERLHPTQNPVPLLERIITAYSNHGDTVLDNCMGSGTTGVACRNTGRDFIGIELDNTYFNIARESIEGTQGEIFERVEG